MKFLKFVLFIVLVFLYANWETYGPKINAQIDAYVPIAIQESVSQGFDRAEGVYINVSAGIDAVRADVKAWSLERSDEVINNLELNEPKTNTFSPILSNFSAVVSGEISIIEKTLALLLIPITLVTWNRAVSLVIIGYILYKVLRTLFSKVKQKRKKTFFDRIGENIPKDEYDADKAKW